MLDVETATPQLKKELVNRLYPVEYTNLEAKPSSTLCSMMSTKSHRYCNERHCGCECHLR